MPDRKFQSYSVAFSGYRKWSASSKISKAQAGGSAASWHVANLRGELVVHLWNVLLLREQSSRAGHMFRFSYLLITFVACSCEVHSLWCFFRTRFFTKAVSDWMQCCVLFARPSSCYCLAPFPRQSAPNLQCCKLFQESAHSSHALPGPRPGHVETHTFTWQPQEQQNLL